MQYLLQIYSIMCYNVDNMGEIVSRSFEVAADDSKWGCWRCVWVFFVCVCVRAYVCASVCARVRACVCVYCTDGEIPWAKHFAVSTSLKLPWKYFHVTLARSIRYLIQ